MLRRSCFYVFSPFSLVKRDNTLLDHVPQVAYVWTSWSSLSSNRLPHLLGLVSLYLLHRLGPPLPSVASPASMAAHKGVVCCPLSLEDTSLFVLRTSLLRSHLSRPAMCARYRSLAKPSLLTRPRQRGCSSVASRSGLSACTVSGSCVVQHRNDVCGVPSRQGNL